MIGGFFSLIIRFAMTMYVLLNFKKMLFMENNSNNTIVDLQDIDAFGVIKYSDTNLKLFHVLQK